MEIGYRVISPDEVGRWGPGLIQISVYRRMPDAVAVVEACASACRNKGHRWVVHPVGFKLTGSAEHLDAIRRIAPMSDRALILHDERSQGGGRLEGDEARRYEEALEELEAGAHISVENATKSSDCPWFWKRFARSVTVDFGHIESEGMDSESFVGHLSEETVGKVEFAHMHCNGPLRGGLTDHWPLHADCRELSGLESLLARKADIGVILEINELEGVDDSIALLDALRDRLGL